MDVGFAHHGDALLVEQAVGGAGHDVDFILQGVPALDGNGIAAVLLRQGLHGHLQFGHVVQIAVLNFAGHVFPAVGNDFLHLGLLGAPLLHFGIQLGQGDGRQLDVELLQQLALVAHGRPEVEGPGADLQNPGVAEHLHHVAHRQKVPDAPFKLGIRQIAVVHVGEGHPEAPQHLARGKQAALAVPQAHAVFVGALVPRAPEQHRHVQLPGQAGALVFRAEIGVGQEQAVHLFPLELLADGGHARVIVEQPLLVDIVDVHKIHAQRPQTVGGQLSVLHGGGGAEDCPAGRGKA